MCELSGFVKQINFLYNKKVRVFNFVFKYIYKTSKKRRTGKLKLKLCFGFCFWVSALEYRLYVFRCVGYKFG